MHSELDRRYGQILQGLKEKIRQARLQAAIAVNSQLLQVYWEVGKLILDEQGKMGWGARIIDKLAADLKMEFNDIKGFSARNLKYMRAFAEAYPGFLQPDVLQNTDNQSQTIVQAPPAQLEPTSTNTLFIRLTWYHHTTLLDKVRDPEIRQFYIQLAAEHGWSRDMMVHQIESGLHERKGRLTHNFKQTLPDYQSDLTRQLFKDPYQLDFIVLGKMARERDLEKALTDNITKVLIELGDGFAFMGRQYKLEVGGQEYFLDLLFYHTKLHRYVVIELKVGNFLPEYAGKMNFYLNVADDRLRGMHDEPSIGLILCRTNNRVVAEYALRDMSKPIGISEYRINEILPENIKSELPSIQDIEQKLAERLELPLRPLDAKLARIREMTGQMNTESLDERDRENVAQLFNVVLPEIENRLAKRLQDIFQEFKATNVIRMINDREGYNTEIDLDAHFLPGSVHRIGIRVDLQGFVKAGIKTFNVWKDLKFELHQYVYKIETFAHQQTTLMERLYGQAWTEEDFNNITENFAEIIVEDIAQNIERIQKN